MKYELKREMTIVLTEFEFVAMYEALRACSNCILVHGRIIEDLRNEFDEIAEELNNDLAAFL